jgi:hypothetical protein
MRDAHAQFESRFVSAWIGLRWRGWVFGFGAGIDSEDAPYVNAMIGPAYVGVAFFT